VKITVGLNWCYAVVMSDCAISYNEFYSETGCFQILPTIEISFSELEIV